jgi:hypothetical protein
MGLLKTKRRTVFMHNRSRIKRRPGRKITINRKTSQLNSWCNIFNEHLIFIEVSINLGGYITAFMIRHWKRSLAIQFQAGAEIFLFATTSRPALGLTQPPIKRIRGSFPEVKRPEGKANHSSPLAPMLRMRGAFSPLC